MSSTGLDPIHLVLLLTFFIGSSTVNALPCGDSRCRTGECNITGACICNFPDPSTILEGDRPFLGGKFCDEKMTMCDGTNAFWCEHGGECMEIVQGENYSCKCPPGYAGDLCQHIGVPCGRLFCFHQAQCLSEGDICDCPPDWKGSVDCLLPTKPHSDSSPIWTKTGFPLEESDRNTNWTVVGLAVSGSVGAVAGGAIYVKKLLNKEKAVPRFRKLSQTQSQDILDDEEENGSA